MSEAPAASDQAARSRAIEARGSVLVQAPAGSGKTTLLTQRYLRLLAQVDSPERILALTFTRRAAQEMRERVLDALGAAQAASCPQGTNATTWQLAVAASRHLQELELNVLRQPARLRIETIDSFNAWLAGQLPIAAGAGSAFRILADPQPSYREAARRTLAYEVPDRFGTAVDRVLAFDDQRWVSLVNLIAKMLETRDRWLPLLAGRARGASALNDAQLAEVRRQLDEDLELLVTRLLARAHDTLGAAAVGRLSVLLRRAAQRAQDSVPRLAAWLAEGSALRAEPSQVAKWRAAAQIMVTADAKKFRKSFTVNEGFPPKCEDKALMQELVEELAKNPAARRICKQLLNLPEPRYSDQQWARVREVAQLLVLAAAQLDQVFRERGSVDFQAVSIAALRALGTADAPTDLALRLDYRLQHILLDEFQDTSSSQLQLVALLTAGWQAGDGRSIFCVGDPMQSIYGFRQAEVRAFLELAEDGIGDVQFEVQRLRDNFRSMPAVIEWINSTFARILPQRDDRERGAIAFRPSTAALVDSPDAAGAPRVALRGFSSRSEEAGMIAAEIAAQLTLHPQWRIVVLVRARAHAREIAARLRARGVPFRAVQIEPLQDRAVVRDIIMLTRALLHWGDRTAWLAVLRAPWAGISLADLLRIAGGASLIWDAMAEPAVLSQMSEEGRRRCSRLRAVLESALQVRNDTSLARWVERSWLALGGASCAASEQELELAAAAFARLREMEQEGMPDSTELLAGFANLYADHGAPSCVEIMTIHKAKGLEFDMVVVPALDRHSPPGGSRLLMSHQFAREGRDGLVLAARPGVGADDDPLFEFLRGQERDASTLEAERLLYVACTRAKHRLLLTAQVGSQESLDAAEDEAPHQVWRPHAGSLLDVLWRVTPAAFDGAPADGNSKAADTGAPRGGPLHRVPAGWQPDAVLHALAGDAQAVSEATREETPIFDWAGETARRVGTLVHAELQALDVARGEAAQISAREPHYRRWLALNGVPEDRLDAAAARVVEALLAIQTDSRGRWILQQRSIDLREYALSGRAKTGGGASAGITRAVFDRSFIDEGIRWVIDYKTSHHSGGAIDEFLDREVERYRPQLQRYAALAALMGPQPVRVGLYFPLMHAWREWIP